LIFSDIETTGIMEERGPEYRLAAFFVGSLFRHVTSTGELLRDVSAVSWDLAEMILEFSKAVLKWINRKTREFRRRNRGRYCGKYFH